MTVKEFLSICFNSDFLLFQIREFNSEEIIYEGNADGIPPELLETAIFTVEIGGTRYQTIVIDAPPEVKAELELQRKLTEIANKHIYRNDGKRENLNPKNNIEWDHIDVEITDLKKALTDAYRLGFEEGAKSK
ncbi:MAG: hypothetical protein UFA98_00640 [Ruminococcus sp.]|nr:hypothetical protein [Ruminococcus sp.]